jgi:lipopolysaccharide transport system permease protein
LWRQRDLLQQLVWHDVTSQHKGSILGAVWFLLTPLLMLSIYTFVFGVIFGARWGQSPGGDGIQSHLEFALNIFCGLIAFNFLAAVLTRASTLVVAHPQYVKKVVFPIALLPLMVLGSALFQAGIAYAVLILAAFLLTGALSWTVLLAPIVLLPLLLLTLGFAWLLAGVGVFIRDLNQVMTPAIQALMFLSPVFYPTSALPEDIRPVLALNPLAWAMEAMRAITLYHSIPSLLEWLAYTSVTSLFAILCYFLFQHLKPAFADVL